MTGYEKRGYLLENFRLFHLRSEGGVKVDYHYHDFCKLLLLVSGSGSYVVEIEAEFYDEKGNLAKIADAETETVFTYDENGNLLKEEFVAFDGDIAFFKV